MNTRNNMLSVLPFALILSASACIGSQEEVSNVTQGVGFPEESEQLLAHIVKELPQSHVVTETYLGPSDGQNEQPGVVTVIRYDYVSRDPVKETKRGGIFLKSNLTHTQYVDQQSANLAMEEMRKKAHPDMGLSYEWDYLVQNSDGIYHLHAGCVYSEQNFYNMAANLDEVIAGSHKENVSTINCRCGGGCKTEVNKEKE